MERENIETNLKSEALDIQSLFFIHVFVANKITIKTKTKIAKLNCGEQTIRRLWRVVVSWPSSELSVVELSREWNRHLDKRRMDVDDCFRCCFLISRGMWRLRRSLNVVRRGITVVQPRATSKQNPILD